MLKNIEGEFFSARHSIKKPKVEGDAMSERYEGITEKGVELAKERAKSILESLERAENGSVMFIGGASEAVRTKSTAEVFGDEIKRIVADEEIDDIIVLAKEDIIKESEKGKKGISKTVKDIAEKIKANSDKKVLIDYPMFLKEFGMGKWLNKKGDDYSEYTYTLLEKHKNDFDPDAGCVADWIENKGVLDNVTGPNPTEVAEDQLRGVERLKKFAKENIGSRPLIVGSAGHSWNLDALAVYLANNGKVNLEGFKKVGGEMIGETEPVQVEIEEDAAVLKYKGKEYKIEAGIEKGE